LLFTRLVKDDRASQGVQEDFYHSDKVGEEWATADRVRTVNTARNEGAGTLSPDGRFLIYTACEVFGDYGGGRRGYGSCDLFISVKVGDAWTPAQNLGPQINTGQWESQPSLGSDGRTLYFIRGATLNDGRRVQNIFVSVMDDSGKWSKPEKLGPNVNTPRVEESVQIHPDGRTLYFSSNGHPGMGGLDIYVSRKQEDGSWGVASNLGYPINTSGDENSVLVSADGQLAFFGSDREGGFGDLDLYSFKTYEGIRPQPVSYVMGKVMDKTTRDPLEADIALLDLITGERISGSYSDPLTGEFLVCLPAGKDYALNASTEGYMFFSENYSFSGVTTIDKPYELVVEMRQLKSGESITLRNVFFETASAELLPASTVELDRLVTLLKSAPDLRVELSGHTDNVGADADNLKLSQARAESVRAYVIDAGIDAGRLEAKGYGETQPVADNDTDSGRAKNRRTEVKVL
jgi:outer membrane protein OmpA-like peptidoglycan-associated protein